MKIDEIPSCPYVEKKSDISEDIVDGNYMTSDENDQYEKKMCWMIFLFLAFIYLVEIGLQFFESICEWLLKQIWKIIEPYMERSQLIELFKQRSLKLLLIPVMALLSMFYICLYFVQIILLYLKKPVPSQISHEINFDVLLQTPKF